jgi:hypothetical protein
VIKDIIMKKWIIQRLVFILLIIALAACAQAPGMRGEPELVETSMVTSPVLMKTPTSKPATITSTQTPPNIIEETLVMGDILIGTPMGPKEQNAVAQAQADLAQRLSIPVDQVKLVEVQSATWPDKGLGCPQPGMSYLQVQVDGLLIRLSVDAHIYEYHSGGNQPPFLCENSP